MAGVAAASTAGLMLGPALWWRLAGGRARLGFGSATESAMGEPRTAVRWAGAALAAASAWALGHGLWLRLTADGLVLRLMAVWRPVQHGLP